MKLTKLAGATSEIWQIFIADSSSTVGLGLAGLAVGGTVPTVYYHRDTDTTATAVTLVSMTVGTFTSSGFKEIDGTNMKGWYQFCPPNAAIASGAKSVAFHFAGATNQAALPIEVQLTAVNPDSATAFITSVATVTTVTNQLTAAAIATGVWQDATGGDFTAASSIGKSLYTSGVVPGGTNGLFIAGTNAATTITTSLTTTFTGSLTGSVASVTGAVGSVTGAVGSVTGLTASDVGAIKTKTDFLPSVTAGASGGVFIAGTNAATTVTTSFTTTFTGSLTGSVGSVTGAVGSVTGAVGSVTAGVTVTTNNDKTGYALSATGSAAFTESYSADGATATLPQLLYGIKALLGEFAITGTTLQTKKLDGASSAEAYTLNDATSPTSITRTG